MLPDGFEIRSPAFDEVEDVAEMLVAIDIADVGTSESDADLIGDQWSSPGFQPSDDAWVVTDPNRSIVAYGNVTPDGEGKIKSWGSSITTTGDAGSEPHSWTGWRLGPPSASGGSPPRCCTRPVNDADASAAALMRSRGFAHVRTFRAPADRPRRPTARSGRAAIRDRDPRH